MKAPLAGPETSWRVRKSHELNSANNPISHPLAGNFQIPMAARKVGFLRKKTMSNIAFSDEKLNLKKSHDTDPTQQQQNFRKF